MTMTHTELQSSIEQLEQIINNLYNHHSHSIPAIANKQLEHDARFDNLEEHLQYVTAQVNEGFTHVKTLVRDLYQQVEQIKDNQEKILANQEKILASNTLILE